MSEESRPITKEIMKAYIEILERQVAQTALIATMLEEIKDKLAISNEKMEEVNMISKMNQRALETSALIEKDINDNAYVLNTDVKNSIGGLKNDISDLRSSIKVDRAVNIIGWSGFLLGILTIILKLYGKL